MADESATKSKLVMYSMGIVAANKPTNSTIIEVSPFEDLSMLSGQLTDSMDQKVTEGTDGQGVPYQTQANTANTIKAKWMGLGSPNQMTAPDVRRGEIVVLYRYADEDADKGYFWVTYKQDLNLRRLETVVYAWSGQPDDAVELTADNMADNMYFLEVSTHKGHLYLHTSKANGEFTTHDLVLDTMNGRLVYEDGVGNQHMIDSRNNRIYMANADGSTFDMDRKNLLINIPENIVINSKTYKLVATDSITWETKNSSLTSTTNSIKSTTTHTGNFTENGALQLNGDMRADPGSGGGSGGSGSIVMAGDFRLLNGSITVAQGGISAPQGTIHGKSVTWDN
jgi:hypothetical protein